MELNRLKYDMNGSFKHPNYPKDYSLTQSYYSIDPRPSTVTIITPAAIREDSVLKLSSKSSLLYVALINSSFFYYMIRW